MKLNAVQAKPKNPHHKNAVAKRTYQRDLELYAFTKNLEPYKAKESIEELILAHSRVENWERVLQLLIFWEESNQECNEDSLHIQAGGAFSLLTEILQALRPQNNLHEDVLIKLSRYILGTIDLIDRTAKPTDTAALFEKWTKLSMNGHCMCLSVKYEKSVLEWFGGTLSGDKLWWFLEQLPPPKAPMGSLQEKIFRKVWSLLTCRTDHLYHIAFVTRPFLNYLRYEGIHGGSKEACEITKSCTLAVESVLPKTGE